MTNSRTGNNPIFLELFLFHITKENYNDYATVPFGASGVLKKNKNITKYFLFVDLEAMKNKALTNAQNAVMNQVKKIDGFERNGMEKKPSSQKSFDTTFSLANPTMNTKKQLPQPKIFEGNLKTYQLKVSSIF